MQSSTLPAVTSKGLLLVVTHIVDISLGPKDKVLDFVILAFHFNWAGERIMRIA